MLRTKPGYVQWVGIAHSLFLFKSLCNTRPLSNICSDEHKHCGNTMIAKSSVKRSILLIKNNSLVRVIKFLVIDRIIGVSKIHRLRIRKDIEISIRSGTTDLESAIDCLLDGELNPLSGYFSSNSGPLLIIDCGAYIGAASIALSEMYPSAKIIAIEASSENYNLLYENVLPYENIFPLHAAFVPDSVVESCVKVYKGMMGNWSNNILDKKSNQVELESVQTVTLSKLLKHYEFPRVAILKMDIEGSELPFLEDLRSLDLVDILAIELHSSECYNAYNIVTNNRFNFKGSGEKYFSINTSQVNA